MSEDMEYRYEYVVSCGEGTLLEQGKFDFLDDAFTDYPSSSYPIGSVIYIERVQ